MRTKWNRTLDGHRTNRGREREDFPGSGRSRGPQVASSLCASITSSTSRTLAHLPAADTRKAILVLRPYLLTGCKWLSPYQIDGIR